MTIVSIETGAEGDLRNVVFSDGSLLSFRTCYLSQVPADTIEPRELDEGEEDDLRFAAACLGAEKAALQLIARAEQTVFGLGRKLAKRGHGSACVKTVTARLREHGLLDDFRYAGLWLESRISRQGSSPMRLLASLRAKGIDREDAGAAMREALDDEAERRLLERFVDKRHGAGRGAGSRHMEDPDLASDEERRSLKYLLKSEGFSSTAIEGFLEERH